MAIQIPFENAGGIPLVQATVAGEAGWLVFDTGAMCTALHRKYFPDLTGKSHGAARFDGSLQATTVEEAVIDAIQIGDAVFPHPTVYRMDFTYVEQGLADVMPEGKLLGSLGFDLLRQHRILMDYGASVITLDPLEPPEDAIAVPLEIGQLATVPVSLQGQEHPFVLDSGANVCLLSSALQGEVLGEPMPDNPELLLVQLAVSGKLFENVPALFSDVSRIQIQCKADSIIGYPLLSAQKTLLDFPEETLYLYQENP